MKIYLALFIIAALAFAGCETRDTAEEARVEAEQTITQGEQFIQNLSQYCNQSFRGRMIFPDDPGHDFAGQELIMHIEYCTPDSMRIPFQVGDNHSRTWIITTTADGLLFKHDHRHDDGTPEDLTMYGGHSADGTQYMQRFPADEETAEMLPEASTNVWTLRLEPDQNEFHYILERHGQPRFHAIFNLAEPVRQ